MNDEKFQELIDLANAHIERRLEPNQKEQLESILHNDPESRRVFVDFMHDHSALHWESMGESETTLLDFPDSETLQASSKPRGFWFAAAAAVVLTSVAFYFLGGNQGAEKTFATMEKTSAARWESGSLPTSRGARLGMGNLNLSEGLAILKFDSGAEVILEAPAEIEIIDQMNVILTAGTAVADVPESAIGFQIKTPTANVVDFGTRFAVNVNGKNGRTKTQVFEGLVEVRHPETGKMVRLEEGENNVVVANQISDAAAGPEEGEWADLSEINKRDPRWRSMVTARDSYVYASGIGDHTSDVLLLLKHSRDKKGPHRKVYLGFDLSKFDVSKIEDAELVLNFTPTGWGLASVVPDATFSVYGITDSQLDSWSYSRMTWENAPANNVKTGNTLKPEKVVKLGEFVVEQGIQRGEFGIQGAELAAFLGGNSDGFATLVIVRETLETAGGGLVHGIASRRHPSLPAPTLAIRLAE